MSSDLFWFWNASDSFKEGLAWMERSLALPRASEPPDVVSEALWATGALAWALGDLDSAAHHLEEALEGFAENDDQVGIARAQMMLGRVPLYRGDPIAAAEFLEQSAATFRELGRPYELALSLGALGVSYAMQDQPSQGLAAAREALDILRDLGDPFFITLAVGDLGWVCYLVGDLGSAEENLAESLALRRDLDSRWLTAQTLNQLAEVERHAGNLAAARAHLEEGLVLAEDVGARAWVAASMRDLGYLAISQGDGEQAAANLLAAIEHYLALEDPMGVARCLEALAGVAAARGSLDEAGVCAAAAVPYRALAGAPASPAAGSDFARVESTLQAAAKTWPQEDWPPIEAALAAVRDLDLALPSPSLVRGRDEPDVRIEALGSTRVSKAGTVLKTADWTYAKPRQLLFYLLESEPRTRNDIGLVFWPDSSPDQVRRNVRSALYHLRKALGSREWVVYESGRYSFDRSLDYRYDVEEFEDLVTEAEQRRPSDPARALGALTRAVDLYRGDFVGDLEDDAWALPRRQQLRQRWIEAMLTKAALEEDDGEFGTAARSYARLVDLEPYNDAAHLGLMTNLARKGDRGGALKHYDDMVSRFAEELGANPGAAVEALAQSLRKGGAV